MLQVQLSRAQHGMVILGNTDTLLASKVKVKPFWPQVGLMFTLP